MSSNAPPLRVDYPPDVNTTYYYAVAALGTNGESFPSDEVALRLNPPPVAGDTNWQAVADAVLSQPVSALLALCRDPGNEALEITAVSPSTNGATVTLTNGMVIYTPVPGFVGQDQFTYTVSDARGGTAQGVVTVTVVAAPVQPMPILSPGFTAQGAFAFNFQGVPGRTYIIERALEIAGPWTNVAEFVIAPEGATRFEDPNPPVPRAFYRLRVP
jgi:hypothetical protein